MWADLYEVGNIIGIGVKVCEIGMHILAYIKSNIISSTYVLTPRG
jgi:hypothetical protein